MVPAPDDEGGMLVHPVVMDVPELCAAECSEGMLEPLAAMVLSMQVSKKDLLIDDVR